MDNWNQGYSVINTKGDHDWTDGYSEIGHLKNPHWAGNYSVIGRSQKKTTNTSPTKHKKYKPRLKKKKFVVESNTPEPPGKRRFEL